MRFISIICAFVAGVAPAFGKPEKPAAVIPPVPVAIRHIDRAAKTITLAPRIEVRTKRIPVSKTVVDNNGRRRVVTEYVSKQYSITRIDRIPLLKSKVYGLNGRRLGTAAALKQLKVGSKVLIAQSPKLSQAQRNKLPANMLVIVPPPPKPAPPPPKAEPAPPMVKPAPPKAEPRAKVMSIDKTSGTVTVYQKVVATKLVPESKFVIDKKGRQRRVTSYRPAKVYYTLNRRLVLKDFKAYQLNGRRIAASAALQRLKKGSTLFLAPTHMLTAAQRKNLPSDSLILVAMKKPASAKKQPK